MIALVHLRITSKYYSLSFGKDYILIEGKGESFCPDCAEWDPVHQFLPYLEEQGTELNVVVAFYGSMAKGCGSDERTEEIKKLEKNPRFKFLYDPQGAIPERFAEISADLF